MGSFFHSDMAKIMYQELIEKIQLVFTLVGEKKV